MGKGQRVLVALNEGLVTSPSSVFRLTRIWRASLSVGIEKKCMENRWVIWKQGLWAPTIEMSFFSEAIATQIYINGTYEHTVAHYRQSDAWV